MGGGDFFSDESKKKKCMTPPLKKILRTPTGRNIIKL